MKEYIKNTVGLLVSLPLGSIAMQNFGNFTGSIASIGKAGSALVATGLLSQSSKLIKWK